MNSICSQETLENDHLNEDLFLDFVVGKLHKNFLEEPHWSSRKNNITNEYDNTNTKNNAVPLHFRRGYIQ
jgi:hypothetical protein